MTGTTPSPVRTVEELAEQANDWRLLAKLLEAPRDDWRRQLIELSADTVDPELDVAVKTAQREGNEYYYDCLFGTHGLLTSRESKYRFECDRGAVIADLHGLSEALGYSRIGPEPADHIVALVDLMAHATALEAEAISDGRIGEAIYLEGVAEWLRGGHLAWFTDQITRALLETEVCYLSHVAYALEARVLPPGKKTQPIPRPSSGDPND